MELERFEDAVRICTGCVERDGDVPFAFQLRAIGQYETGHYQETIDDATQAIELNPSAHGAFYMRSLAKGELFGVEQMREDYEKARELGADLVPFDEQGQEG